MIHTQLAAKALDSGLTIWANYGNSKHASVRRAALANKARALVQHDRFLNMDYWRTLKK